MAQSDKCQTLDFGSGHELMVPEFEPHVRQTARSLLGILALPLSLSLSQNKYFKKKIQVLRQSDSVGLP